MPDKQTALIGIGNMFRRDDGVGIAIVRNLKRCLSAFDQNGLEIFECSGEGTELMECWQGFQRVIIFDAVMANGEPGKIYRLQADRQFIPSDFSNIPVMLSVSQKRSNSPGCWTACRTT